MRNILIVLILKLSWKDVKIPIRIFISNRNLGMSPNTSAYKQKMMMTIKEYAKREKRVEKFL